MRRIVFVALFAFLITQTLFAQAQLNPEKLRVFEQYVQKQMESEKIPGLTIGFIKDGKTWVKGYGYSDLENKIPTKPESAYRLASITKPMTAIAILQLVEQGKIDLNAEVQTYVPYFPKKKYPVRVGQLLGHIGGISHYKNYDLEGHFKDHKNTREAIKVFEDFDLIAEPGTRYNYTSYGYNLLGAVIEGASGKPYGEYMRENVWKPLEMNDTVMDDPNIIIPNRVRGYRLLNGKVANSEFVDISSRFSAGGTRSTVVDLLKFGDGMSRGKLLSDETRNKMWTSMATNEGMYTYYGMGWGTGSLNGQFMVSHSGSQAETRTILYVFPNHNFAVAAAINFEDANPALFAQKLYEIITENIWNLSIYNKNPNDTIALRGIDGSFRNGMQHFDRFGKAITNDENELKKSFAYFNSSLKMSGQESLTNLRKGFNPAGNLMILKMSSYMAKILKENSSEKDFDKYFINGGITFFDDYIKWYQKNPNHPAELKFDEDFEQKVDKWNKDWSKVWNAFSQKLKISESTDLAEVEKNLQNSFSSSTLVPNYINEIDALVRNSVTNGNFPKAIQAGSLGVNLYPESDRTNGLLGLLYLLSGNKDKGIGYINKSFKIDPKGYTSANNLNNVAYELAGINQRQAGLAILQIAVGLHPNEANLYDSLGEFHMNLKENEKAIEFYSKALEINPNYPNAANAKKVLEKLKEIK